jgi:hypothetical protein
MTEEMTAKTYDANFFADQLDKEAARAAEAGGKRNEYLKLGGGQNDIRILPCDPLFALLKKHGYKNAEGRFTSALDYGYLLTLPELASAAVAKGKINGDDIAQAQSIGDPFTALARTAQQLGVDEDLYKQLWPRSRYIWNAVDRTKNDEVVRLFESSKQFFDQILDVFKAAPDLFDPEEGRDIGIKGNGQDGMRRRYNPPIASMQVSPVGFEFDELLIDLNDVVVRSIRPWAEKARAMFAKHGDLAAQVGITPDAWGL